MISAKAGPSDGPAFVAPALSDGAQLWLLRHGETEWSLSGQHTSVTDLPLTAQGERQASAMAPMVADIHPVLVLSSPRGRALQTAQLAGFDDVQIDEDLAEWNYGEYEGRTTVDIRKEVPDWSLWADGVPGGETAAEIASRADRVLTRAALALGDGPVVLVGHGHFSRVLAVRWIGLQVRAGANLLLGTAAPSVLGAQHGEPVIDRWNLPNPAAEGTS